MSIFCEHKILQSHCHGLPSKPKIQLIEFFKVKGYLQLYPQGTYISSYLTVHAACYASCYEACYASWNVVHNVNSDPVISLLSTYISLIPRGVIANKLSPRMR